MVVAGFSGGIDDHIRMALNAFPYNHIRRYRERPGTGGARPVGWSAPRFAGADARQTGCQVSTSRADVVETGVMPATDEDLLIDDAISQRKSHKRGYNLLATLCLAAGFAAVGWVLAFWLRRVVKSIPLLPLGTVSTSLLVLGIVAFVIAGLLVAGAFFAANPWSRWGDAAPGTCPLCGKRSLRSETIEHAAWEEGHPEAGIKKGPRGVVTLCETPGCPYATVKVTTPSAG
jgi:hypothetical protein